MTIFMTARVYVQREFFINKTYIFHIVTQWHMSGDTLRQHYNPIPVMDDFRIYHKKIILFSYN